MNKNINALHVEFSVVVISKLFLDNNRRLSASVRKLRTKFNNELAILLIAGGRVGWRQSLGELPPLNEL